MLIWLKVTTDAARVGVAERERKREIVVSLRMCSQWPGSGSLTPASGNSIQVSPAGGRDLIVKLSSLCARVCVGRKLESGAEAGIKARHSGVEIHHLNQHLNL